MSYMQSKGKVPVLGVSTSFSRNVIILMTGTIIAQAIPLAVSPLLTRIFSPEDFGLFALYFSISQIICVFITARYESAIILPENDDDGINLVALSVSITCAVTAILLIIVFISRTVLKNLLTEAGLFNYILLMPLTVFSIGIYNTFNLWLNRQKKFTGISAGKIIRSSFSSGLSIGFGFTILKSAGLIIADTIGQFIAGIYVFFMSFRYKRRLLDAVSGKKMVSMAKRYSHFPKYNVVSGLFEKGSGQIPVILLSSFFGASVTGFFSLSQRIIAAPGSLIGVSVGDVFRQHASVEYKETGNCHSTFMKLFKLLLLVAVIPFTVILLFSPVLFRLFLAMNGELQASMPR
jgi:O-antigen/teichoic acid export membrane protein